MDCSRLPWFDGSTSYSRFLSATAARNLAGLVGLRCSCQLCPRSSVQYSSACAPYIHAFPSPDDANCVSPHKSGGLEGKGGMTVASVVALSLAEGLPGEFCAGLPAVCGLFAPVFWAILLLTEGSTGLRLAGGSSPTPTREIVHGSPWLEAMTS